MSTRDEKMAEPGGFALLPKSLLAIWSYLPEHHMRLLPLILSFGGENGADAFPGQKLLAALAGRSRQSVNEATGQMVAAGLLVITHRYREWDKGQTSSLYQLADLADAATREKIVAWYKSEFPRRRTHVGRKPRKAKTARPVSTSGVDTGVSETAQACVRNDTGVSTPGVYTGCQPQEFTGGVNSKGLHPVSTLAVDTTVPAERTTQPDHVTQSSRLTPTSSASVTGDAQPAEPETLVDINVPPSASVAAPPPATETKAGGKQRRERRSATARPVVANVAAELTPEQRHQICASAATMQQYLLATEPTNWRRFEGATKEAKIAQWDVTAFAGYYWWRVSTYREQRGEAITLPDWRRLKGFREVRNTVVAEVFFTYIVTLTQHFDLIRFRLGRAGASLQLDEASFGNMLVCSEVSVLTQMTQERIEVEYERMRIEQNRFGTAA